MHTVSAFSLSSLPKAEIYFQTETKWMLNRIYSSDALLVAKQLFISLLWINKLNTTHKHFFLSATVKEKHC